MEVNGPEKPIEFETFHSPNLHREGFPSARDFHTVPFLSQLTWYDVIQSTAP